MFTIGDYIVYKKDVCEIKDIKKKHFNDQDYYILAPVTDQSLKIEVPTLNKNGFIRELITKENLEKVIKKIPDIEVIDIHEKLIEKEYKKLMLSGTYEDLIKIIKTSYGRNKVRIDNNKKISDRDDRYFKQAEKYLYTEFSIVLNKDYDETKKYIIDKVTKLS